MAHIQINTKPGGPVQLLINGIDYSMEAFRGFEVVEVGDGKNPEFDEVGLRVTFAVSTLSIDTEADVQLTDNVPAVAARVRSMVEAD